MHNGGSGGRGGRYGGRCGSGRSCRDGRGLAQVPLVDSHHKKVDESTLKKDGTTTIGSFMKSRNIIEEMVEF